MDGHDHGPVDARTRETIDLWVSDFLDRPAAREVAARAGPAAPDVLATFLEACCHGGRAPADVEPEDASHAFLDHVSRLALDPGPRSALPDLVAAFLADLEDQGRLSGGRAMAARVRAAEPAFRDRAAGKAPDLTRRAEKIGRNDPCPCGSGRKYKQCHLRG
jgi:preprotein translocase subunit SecA